MANCVAIRQHLGRALDDGLSRLADLKQHSPELARAHALDKASEAIVGALGSHPAFGSRPGRMINLGWGATAFSADVIGPKLLQIAEERGSTSAVDWLNHVLDTTKAEALCIVALSGIQVDTAGMLVEDIQMLPFGDLPDSNNKQTLGQRSFDSRLFATSLGRLPTAALMSRVQIEPFFVGHSDVPESWTNLPKELERLESAAQVLSALGPSAPTIAASWIQFSDEDLRKAVLGEGRTWPHHEIVSRDMSEPYELQLSAAQKLVTAYFALAEVDRGRFKIALQRLNQAVRRASIGDKAIEAAIALESLLTEDGQNEITFRLTLRAALLLGGSLEKRKKTRDLLRALYGKMRSKVVHGKPVPDSITVEGKKMASGEVAREALEIVANVIQTLIARGSFPNWNEVELGAAELENAAAARS